MAWAEVEQARGPAAQAGDGGRRVGGGFQVDALGGDGVRFNPEAEVADRGLIETARGASMHGDAGRFAGVDEEGAVQVAGDDPAHAVFPRQPQQALTGFGRPVRVAFRFGGVAHVGRAVGDQDDVGSLRAPVFFQGGGDEFPLLMEFHRVDARVAGGFRVEDDEGDVVVHVVVVVGPVAVAECPQAVRVHDVVVARRVERRSGEVAGLE